MLASFHEVLFPTDIAVRARGGPERLTEVVTLASGREERNQRWAMSRRRYDAGHGVRSLDRLRAILAFFEERRGRLIGFRFRDRLDHSSAADGGAPGPLDQVLGTGDGNRASFPLVKRYGGALHPYDRLIVKPVAGSIRVAVAGAEAPAATFAADPTTGLVTFAPAAIPPAGAVVTAGFLFDVPVRFDTDRLEIDFAAFAAFAAGSVPAIPLIEILP